MAEVIKAYAFVGDYTYNKEFDKTGGNMSGTALLYDDKKFVGIMRDKDDGVNEEESLKYLLGKFHDNGHISLWKIAPLERNLKQVCWSFKPAQKEYIFTGGWAFLRTTLELIAISSIPSLQGVASLCTEYFEFLSEEESHAIFEKGRQYGQTGNLIIDEIKDLSAVRNELRL